MIPWDPEAEGADAMAEGALDREFLARLHAFIRRRVPSAADADDTLQDVLVKLVEHRSEVREESIPAWLYSVARRAVIDRYRARPGPLPLPAMDSIAKETPPPDAVAELARCLEPLLARLTAEDREILLRVDAADERQSEIARGIGVPPSTVKSRVQRARDRLRAELEGCCEIALDPRGVPRDFVRNPGAPCVCEDDAASPG